jgi:hypothetical protein
MDIRKVFFHWVIWFGWISYLAAISAAVFCSRNASSTTFGLEFRIVTLSHDGDWSLPVLASDGAMVSP